MSKKKRNIDESVAFDLDKQFSAVSSQTSSPTARHLYSEPDKISGVNSDDLANTDPLFRLLADPKLPQLPKDDRARLQLQSPNRIHFYWSVKTNPFKVLNKALNGRTGNYVLVARLKNITTGNEKIFPVEASGNWWFDVDADCEYRAEIGFYAPNRPYVRIIHSNKLQTPRKAPSMRTDYTPSFSVTSKEFASALDAAGYRKDAFDISLAGDDIVGSQEATTRSYKGLTGKKFGGASGRHESELRFVLMAIASGYSLDEIKSLIDPTLFDLIRKDLESIAADDAMMVLEEHFDVVAGDVFETEEFSEAVHGASLINFPRRIRQRRVPKSLLPKIDELKHPVSVTSFGKV